MAAPYLIFDANYMARRAFYSRAGMLERGTIFGFLKDVAACLDYFQSQTAVFCWDSKHSERMRLFPRYKEARKKRIEGLNPKDFKRETHFYRQVHNLRDKILTRELGYANNFVQSGYEADDLIAVCCQTFPGRLVIVSADHDLYQLLSEHVRIWNPAQRKLMTFNSFVRKYDIYPDQWVDVKAIAGCSSDSIPGVGGAGEWRAVQYVCGQLGPKSKLYRKIIAAGELVERNRALIRLPFPGTEHCEPQRDSCSPERWRKFSKAYEMPFLAGLFSNHRRPYVKK